MTKASDYLDLYGQIGDMKEVNYRNTLAIATLIELLCEKNIINKHQFYTFANKLDSMSTEELKILKSTQGI